MSKSLAEFNSCNHEGHTPSLCPHLVGDAVPISAEQSLVLDLDNRLRRIETMLTEMFELQKETCDRVDLIQDDVNQLLFDDDYEEDGEDVTEGV